jgi:DNA-binding MarR family transcriptional regulator
MSANHNGGRPSVVHDREELLREAVRRSMVMRQLLRLAVQRCRGEAGEESDVHLGDARFHVLHALRAEPSLTIGELAEQCHVADPTVSKMLNHLESAGLIERRLDPTNRRVVRVRLTEAGRAAEERLARRFQAALVDVLRPLSDDQLADVVAAFGHLEQLVGTPERAS